MRALRAPRRALLRRGALRNGLAYFTTIRGARAALAAIRLARREQPAVRSLQRYQAD